MTKEITILVPDVKENENIDIKVIAGGKAVMEYRLEFFIYDAKVHQQSRLAFVEEKLAQYDKKYSLVEIGSHSVEKIPVLFRYSGDFNTDLKERNA